MALTDIINERPIDVLYAGHYCWDLIPPFKSEDFKSFSEAIQPDRMTQMGRPVQAAGGPVTNTGVSIAKLGQKVALIGKIGDDDFGYLTKRWYDRIEKELPNLDYSGIKMDKDPNIWTSNTIALIPKKVDRAYLHGCGANDDFGFKDMDFDKVRNARIMAFGYPPWMKRIYENNGRDLTDILKVTKALGTTTALDLSIPQAGTEAGNQDWKSILTDWIPHTDIMMPSAEEIYMFLRRDEYFAKRKKLKKNESILDHMDTKLISSLGQEMLDMGAGIAIIKCGQYGVYIRTAGKKRLEKCGAGKPADCKNWANRELWLAPYDISGQPWGGTLGAGDSAVAGLITSLLKGYNIENCLRYAVAAGTRNVTVPDGLSWNKGFDDLTERILTNKWRTQNMKQIGRDMPKWKQYNEFWVGPADKGTKVNYNLITPK